MKQPELGKMISELRKQKGLTQEDLVEKCNISVRTIQRIEAGEVSPRSYTLKIILEVLGYDLERMKEEFDLSGRKAIQIPKYFSFVMNLAFWIGIVFIVAEALNIFLGMVMGLKPTHSYLIGFRVSETLYIIVQMVCAICAFVFYLGFFMAGNVLKNLLLKVSAILFIVVEVTSFSTSAFMFDAEKFTSLYYSIFTMIFYGCVGIPFGIGILRLNNHLGSYATITGVFTIILYSTLLAVILFFVAMFLWLPVMILQLILLYKVKEQYDFTKNIP